MSSVEENTQEERMNNPSRAIRSSPPKKVVFVQGENQGWFKQFSGLRLICLYMPCFDPVVHNSAAYWSVGSLVLRPLWKGIVTFPGGRPRNIKSTKQVIMNRSTISRPSCVFFLLRSSIRLEEKSYFDGRCDAILLQKTLKITLENTNKRHWNN